MQECVEGLLRDNTRMSGIPTVSEKIENEVPAGRETRAIVDNDSAHKHGNVRNWRAAHRRWTFHFTPTSCSWMNAVEGFFGNLARRRVRRGVYESI